MNADERLGLVRLKVERAEMHFIELDAAIRTFMATKPYRVVRKVGPQYPYEISRADPVPDSIGAIIGDAVQNLRSALDHLSRQLLFVAMQVETSDAETQFPIRNKASEYESLLGRIKKQGFLREDAFDALQGIKAYKGGKGNALWVLNRLNNIDKHRVILTTGASLQSVNLGAAISRMPLPSYKAADGTRRELGTGLPIPRDPPIANLFIRPAEIQCPLKLGDKLLINAGMEMDPDNDFRFDISLNEPEVTQPRPILETVKEFTDIVDATIRALRPCLN